MVVVVAAWGGESRRGVKRAACGIVVEIWGETAFDEEQCPANRQGYVPQRFETNGGGRENFVYEQCVSTLTVFKSARGSTESAPRFSLL